MKKSILALLVLALFAVKASAQKSKFNIGLEGAIPVGNASNAYSWGFGVSGKLEVPIAQSTYFTANAGFTSMQLTSDIKAVFKYLGQDISSRNFIPVEVGARYYFVPHFYGEGQVGAAFCTAKGAGTAFAYTPGVGFAFPLAGGDAIDLGVRYEAWDKDGTLGFMGVRVAYKFGL